MSTLIGKHNNGDPADVEFDFAQVTFLLPNRKGTACTDAAACIALSDTSETHADGKIAGPFLIPLPPDS